MQAKRKVRTSAEMYPIVEQWQKSGIGKESFAKEQGLRYSTFQYWCSHYRNGHRGKAAAAGEAVSLAARASAFVPLQVLAEPAASATAVVIVLASGTRIEVR